MRVESVRCVCKCGEVNDTNWNTFRSESGSKLIVVNLMAQVLHLLLK
jgi:hypothetical protein